MRILRFGTYDRDVGRNAIVDAALRAAGHQVVVRHRPLWRDTSDKLRAMRCAGPSAVSMVALRLARAQAGLVRSVASAGAVDAVLVGSTGHFDLPLARTVANRLGVPLVFDPLVSANETVRDRGLMSGNRARMLALVERGLFRLPDLILADTNVHAAAWRVELGVPADRLAVLPLGARQAFRAAPRYIARATETIGHEDPFRVLYFGQYIPLHGVPTIIHAAQLLSERPDIAFTFVGRGQTLEEARALAASFHLTGLRFVDDWLDETTLVERFVAEADLCLGIFGDSPKAARVVPYKVHAAVAAGRPVLTADTPAIREQFTPGDELAVVAPADPERLAAVIVALADDPSARARLALRARSAHAQRFAPAPLGVHLSALLDDLVARHRAASHGPRHEHRTARLAETIDDVDAGRAASTVLDAGCGDGTLAIQLARRWTVLACDLDLSRVRLARARARRDGLETRFMPFVADLEALPLMDGRSNGTAAGLHAPVAVVCGEVMEHVADDRRAALELRRVLRPGGRLAMTVPAGADRFSAIDISAGHRRRYDRRRLIDLCHNAGLERVTIRGWGYPFGRLYDRWLQRTALNAPPSRRKRFARLAGSRPVAATCHALFGIDRRLESIGARLETDAGRGSGWLVIGHRPDTQDTADAG